MQAADNTALTNLFTGRPARGIVNRLMREVGPVSANAPEFPLAAARLRRCARQRSRRLRRFHVAVVGPGRAARPPIAGRRADAPALVGRPSRLRSVRGTGAATCVLRNRNRWTRLCFNGCNQANCCRPDPDRRRHRRAHGGAPCRCHCPTSRAAVRTQMGRLSLHGLSTATVVDLRAKSGKPLGRYFPR